MSICNYYFPNESEITTELVLTLTLSEPDTDLVI